MKRFFAIWVLISLMIGSLGLTEAFARGARPTPARPNRPAPTRPNRPIQNPPANRPNRPAQPPKPRPDRPAPPRPRPDRPQPPRPNPVRPVRPLPPRPLPPRPVYPYPPRYPNYYYNDARRSGWGLLWGLPVLAALNSNQLEINITVQQESTSTQQAGSISTSDVERLAAELKSVVEKDPVDKLKAMEIYSQIRTTSQKIADENFSAYLKTVNDVPPGENFNAPMEIPDNVSSEMRKQMLDLQGLAQELRDELRKRPVDKVKAIDLYATVRRKGQAIADDRFYDYLSSIR